MNKFTNALLYINHLDLKVCLSGENYPWFYQDFLNMAPEEIFCFQHTFIKDYNLYHPSLNKNYIKIFDPLLEKINFLEDNVFWKAHLAQSLMITKSASKKEVPFNIKDGRKIALYCIKDDDGGIKINDKFYKNEKNILYLINSSDKLEFVTCQESNRSLYILVDYEKF